MQTQPNPSDPEMKATTGARVAPIRILFLCSDNSARSPMAEAILRSLGGTRFQAFSAGVEAAPAMDPNALGILSQRHVSSDGLAPKDLRTLAAQSFDYVVTLSDPAREQAPIFPAADAIHWSFADPEVSLDEQTDAHPFEHLFAGLAQRIRLLMIIAERREREGRVPDAEVASTTSHTASVNEEGKAARV